MTSGWCSAPAGARPQHGQCRSAVCSCRCHLENGESLSTEGRKVLAMSAQTCENSSARSQRELTPGHDHSPAKDK